MTLKPDKSLNSNLSFLNSKIRFIFSTKLSTSLFTSHLNLNFEVLNLKQQTLEFTSAKKENVMYYGSCLCGAIQYQVAGNIGDSVICHCQRCRKANGSAFAVNAPIQKADFNLLNGHTMLKQYESSSGVHRFFCGQCGAPIYSQRDNDAQYLRLRLGTLDTPLHQQPKMHVFTASKAEWDNIYDDLPQFAERP